MHTHIHSRCFSHYRGSHASVRVRNSHLLQHSDQWEQPIMTPVLYGEGQTSSLSTGPVMDTLPSLMSVGHSLPLLPRKLIQQIKVSSLILQSFRQQRTGKSRQQTITPIYSWYSFRAWGNSGSSYQII